MGKKKTGTPRIYVAALSAYNSGRLHGAWIDADQEPAEIRREIQAMLKKSPEPNEEEWAIHDYEGFGKMNLSEYEDIETVSAAAQAIAEHGDVFIGLLDHFGGAKHLDEALEAMTENYAGQYKSVEDFVEEFYEEGGDLKKVPEGLRNYIDWEKVARDWDFNGDIFTVEGKHHDEVHIFWSR